MEKPDHPDCYWVEPGRLLAGEYPGAVYAPDARAKLKALVACGIRTFVDLTEDGELDPYEDLLKDEAAAAGVEVRYVRRPVRDLHAPTEAEMRETLDTIARALDADLPVYVHCWGGVGRTGTVVACWLAERGMAADGDLFALVADLRDACTKRLRPSPETPVQEAFVIGWCAAARPGG